MGNGNPKYPLQQDAYAPFALYGGQPLGPQGVSIAGIVNNKYKRRGATADNMNTVDVYSVDAENNLHIGSALYKPTLRPITFKAVANGSIVTTRFHCFGSGITGQIMAISEIHNTAGNHASAVTLEITKETTGQAPGAGTSLMSGTFNLKGTANTQQNATLNTTDLNVNGTPITYFSGNEMLSVKLTGNAQTAAGVFIIIWVAYDLPVFETSWYSAAVTSQDQNFFVANRPYPLRSLQEVHAVAETTDATSNVQVTIDTGTDAPGGGTDLLTDDSNAGFDLNAVANTPQNGTLAAATTFSAGNRTGIDFNSSNTEAAGVCITATFNTEETARIEITHWLYDGDNTDAWFFIADRSYDLWDGRFLFAVTAGGVSTMNIEKSSGTTNASSGTAELATAVDLAGTANTVVVADIVTVKATYLVSSAERLAVDYANAEQNTVGICFTLSLRSR